MLRFAVAWLLCLAAVVPPAAAQRQIKIVDVMRGRTFGAGGSSIPAGDDKSVVLVLTLSGFSETDWNRLPLSAFTVSDGEQKFPCRLRTAMDLRPALSLRSVPNSAVGDPRVVFVVPADAASLYLHFRNQTPIEIMLKGRIESTLR